MHVTFTDEQKFLFDLKGWCMIPSVLSDSEIQTIKAHIYAMRDDPDSLPETERSAHGGPTGALLDHPQAVAVLRELIRPDFQDEAYGFRCDNSFYTIRSAGWNEALDPHGCNPEHWRTQHTVSKRAGPIVPAHALRGN